MSHPEATHSDQNHVSSVTTAETHQNKPGGQMSDRIETILARILSEHFLEDRQCTCGWIVGGENSEHVFWDEHAAAAILAALKAARIAVVDMESVDCDDVHSGDSRGHLIFVELDPGEPIEVSPEFARQIAAALLAAADAAESAAVGARITVEEQ